MDAGQAALVLGRHELANLAGNRDLRRGRFPLVGGAEPSDGLLVGRDFGSGWKDGARAKNEVEIRVGCVVPDEGRIGNGIEVAGQIDRDDVDVDLHEGECAVVPRLGIGKKAVARGAAAERGRQLEMLMATWSVNMPEKDRLFSSKCTAIRFCHVAECGGPPLTSGRLPTATGEVCSASNSTGERHLSAWWNRIMLEYVTIYVNAGNGRL
jgi:hypothetical protein